MDRETAVVSNHCRSWGCVSKIAVSLGCWLLVAGCGGPSQTPIDYPTRLSLISQLEGRLGTLRNTAPGHARGFHPDLDVSPLVGVQSAHVRARLGEPMTCSGTRPAVVCRRSSEWVYPFFVGQRPRRATYLIVDPNGSDRIKSATWRVVR